jgi:hypothetical protein
MRAVKQKSQILRVRAQIREWARERGGVAGLFSLYQFFGGELWKLGFLSSSMRQLEKRDKTKIKNQPNTHTSYKKQKQSIFTVVNTLL